MLLAILVLLRLQAVVIQLAQRKAEHFMTSIDRLHTDDVIFISALELSMFTRRPRKTMGSAKDSTEQRYSSATVLLAMSHQHGCIAFDVWFAFS